MNAPAPDANPPGPGVPGSDVPQVSDTSSRPASPRSSGPIRVQVPVRLAQPVQQARPRPAAGPLPGQVSRDQAEIEARAKISWGEPEREVKAYLRAQGFAPEEAEELVNGLLAVRTAEIRGKGITKIVVGIGMILLPFIAFAVFWAIGVIYLKPFAVTIIIGLGGIAVVVNGIWMLASPKSETGDVAGD